jgi:LysR family glycine cleavage system transcriptional activator
LGCRTLLALDAAVRHSSFTAAAEELPLTQSAICRHIASLEDYLAVELFRRTRRGVVPTEAGRAYGQRVSLWLDGIERDTLELMSRRGAGGELTLAVVATFAQCWLLPRLPDFGRQHPQITLNFMTRTRPFLFQDTNIAAAIFGGEGAWEGTERVFLLSEQLIPVASPALTGHRNALLPKDFSRHRLFHLDTRPLAWRDRLRRAGVPVANDMAGPRFDLYSLIAEAAVQGLGIGLVPRFTVERDLRHGRLVRRRRNSPPIRAPHMNAAAKIRPTTIWSIPSSTWKMPCSVPSAIGSSSNATPLWIPLPPASAQQACRAKKLFPLAMPCPHWSLHAAKHIRSFPTGQPDRSRHRRPPRDRPGDCPRPGRCWRAAGNPSCRHGRRGDRRRQRGAGN